MSTSKNSCGPHVELSSNAAVRVARCACGVVHVHLQAQGISLRIDEEALRHLANAFTGAARLLDVAETIDTPKRDDVVN